jgi:hypothetical protein
LVTWKPPPAFFTPTRVDHFDGRIISGSKCVHEPARREVTGFGCVRPSWRQTKTRMWDVRNSAILDPGQDLAGEGIVILLEHHHVAVALNSVIAEMKEIRLRAVLIKPLDYGLVQFARMSDICGSACALGAIFKLRVRRRISARRFGPATFEPLGAIDRRAVKSSCP